MSIATTILASASCLAAGEGSGDVFADTWVGTQANTRKDTP